MVLVLLFSNEIFLFAKKKIPLHAKKCWKREMTTYNDMTNSCRESLLSSITSSCMKGKKREREKQRWKDRLYIYKWRSLFDWLWHARMHIYVSFFLFQKDVQKVTLSMSSIDKSINSFWWISSRAKPIRKITSMPYVHIYTQNKLIETFVK